jgi:hypothetical protein
LQTAGMSSVAHVIQPGVSLLTGVGAILAVLTLIAGLFGFLREITLATSSIHVSLAGTSPQK